MKKLIPIYELIRDSLTSWGQTEALWYAAGLSFYTLFSFAPLLSITIGIISLLINQAVATQAVIEAIERLLGPDLAALAAETLARSSIETNLSTSGLIVTLIGFGILFYSASLFFYKLAEAINEMWDIKIERGSTPKAIMLMIRNRAIGGAAVLIFGFLILVLIILSAFFVVGPMKLIEEYIPDIQLIASLVSWIVTPLIFWLVFILVYKYFPQARVRWRDVLPGAALTAVLFYLGNAIIWLALSFSSYGAIYGAAASIVGMLIWVNYSTMIVLYGAKFIQFYAQRYGLPIIPVETDTTFLEKLMSKYSLKPKA
jgi:membrane protein